jgi:hypothetical protein
MRPGEADHVATKGGAKDVRSHRQAIPPGVPGEYDGGGCAWLRRRSAGPRRRELEEVFRHQDRRESDQGSSRRNASAIREGVHGADRHPGLGRTDAGAAAASEGGDRAHLGQPELRRHSYQLPRPEAPVREGELARRYRPLSEESRIDRGEPHRGRFLPGGPDLREEPAGAASLAAVLCGLLDALLALTASWRAG